MPNTKISQDVTVAYKAALLIPAVDLTLAAGAQNVNIRSDGLIGAVIPIIPQQPLTSNFWANFGGVINRLNDRVFIGAATLNDGNAPSTIKDFCETYRVATTNNSQLAVLSTLGLIGILGASETKDYPSANAGCIGLCGYAFSNTTGGLSSDAWAGYFETQVKSGSTGFSAGIEIDIVNQRGTYGPLQPYAPFPAGASQGLVVASGGLQPGAATASVALAIVNNGANFDKGIVFHSTALNGTDGVTGSGVAIALARGHVIEWYTPNGSQAGAITSVTNATTPAPITMQFTNTGLQFFNTSGQGLLGLSPNPPALGATALGVLVNNSVGVNEATVSLGAIDSGGTGFRALRVPN